MPSMPDLFEGFWANVAANAAYALAIFVAGALLRTALDWWRNRHFRRFWGSRTRRDEAPFLIVTGVYEDTRPRANGRYVKTFSSGQQLQLIGGDEAGSQAEVRAAAYIATEIGRYKRRQVITDTDDRLQQRWDGTTVALGSGGSNEKSAVILGLPTNVSCRFDAGGIRSLWDGALHAVRMPAQQPIVDVGLIVKVPNPWFVGHSLFVCAGMNEQGTSGAAFYLARNWRALLSRYGERSFGVVLEVQWGSDQTAIPTAYSP